MRLGSRGAACLVLGTLALLLTGCPKLRLPGAPPPPPPPPRKEAVAWKARVTEYRRTYPGGGALALFRYDRLEGRDAATGRRLWAFSTTLTGRPVMQGGTGYFGVVRSGLRGPAVNAYDLVTGRRHWASPDLSRGLPRGGFPRPTLGGARLAADDAGVGALLRGWFPDDAAERPPGGVEVAVVGLDAADGKLAWQTRLPDHAPTEELPLAVVPGWVVAHDGRETAGIDRRTGAVAWRNPSPLAAEIEPLSPTRIAVLARTRSGWSLSAREAASGAPVWSGDLPAEGQERFLAVGKGGVAVQFDQPAGGGPSPTGAVALMDPATGRVRWTVTPDPALRGQISWPIGVAFLPDGRLAAGYQTSRPTRWTLYLLDPASGKTVWHRRTTDALQEVIVTPSGLLILHESGYGHGQDRLTALQPPGTG